MESSADQESTLSAVLGIVSFLACCASIAWSLS